MLTILCAHPCKDEVALLVHLNIPDAIPAPLAEQNSNFLSGPSLEDTETKMAPSGLHAEETSEPVLLNLNLSDPTIAVGPNPRS